MFTRTEKILYSLALLSLFMAALIAAEEYSKYIGKKSYEEAIRTYKTEVISVQSAEKR
jgi:hypothetical protein